LNDCYKYPYIFSTFSKTISKTMLTAENRSAKAAIDYFTQGHKSNFARWYGKGAETLGLQGTIESKEIFANVCSGLTPCGGMKLGSNTKRAAIDLTFSVPKSVSLSALLGGDNNLITAHHKAVEKTLSVIQQYYAQTRIYMGSNRYHFNTGNLIAAQFDHIESRELDPHLHTHALVMNLTQIQDGRWYSLNNGDIYKDKKPLGLLYHSHLKEEIEKLGYDIENGIDGQFEIKGYNREDLINFSKRRQQIISKVGSEASWKGREEAWSITRRAKQYLPLEELKDLWHKQAQELGIEPVILKSQVEQRETVIQQPDREAQNLPQQRGIRL
jgi:conjugative relaxase-like TrwC/TraI family protein